MGFPYDNFVKPFLAKITQYDFPQDESLRNDLVDGYMKRAISEFRRICKYDFVSSANDDARIFDVDVPLEDEDELTDIVSEGMVVQWLKVYLYHQDLLESHLNTRDFSGYSPAELLNRVRETYGDVKRDFTNMMREYSYDHGDISSLHL